MKAGDTARRFAGAATTNNLAGALIVMMALAIPSFAQMGGASPELQQKLAALKQSATANKQKLHQYQWVETRQITYKGEAKPQQNFQCSYGPDGKVQKVPMGPPPQQSGRQGRLKERVVEKKTDELKDYMQQVQSLLSMYVPPSAQRMQKAFEAHNVSIVPGGGSPQLVFKNYAQPGDQMTVSFDMATKKIQSLNVNTYLSESKDVVTLAVQFGSLPDGTNYAQQINLDATAKQLQVAMTNSNYSRLGQ
jgi:hypothetical protein